MVGCIVNVKGLGRSEILSVGKTDCLIKWLDDINEDKWELFVPLSDIIIDE